MDRTFESACIALGKDIATPRGSRCRDSARFEDFVRSIEPWVGRKSGYLLGRFLGSNARWIDRDDVAQSIRLHLWRAFLSFDSDRRGGSAPIQRHLSFSAVHKVIRDLRRARKISIESESLEGEGVPVPREEAIAEDAIVRRERYESLRAGCRTKTERYVIDALESGGGQLGAATGWLWDNRAARLACRLVSEEHAARVVRAAVCRLVRDLGMAPACGRSRNM
jgi:hypothetical protein